MIAIYEDIVNTDLTIDNINGLLSLYQKAIEYFSAQDSGRYEDFLNRNRMLLQREDVQAILSSIQDEESKDKKDSHIHRYVKSKYFYSLDPPEDHHKDKKSDDVFLIGSDDSGSNKSIPDIGKLEEDRQPSKFKPEDAKKAHKNEDHKQEEAKEEHKKEEVNEHAKEIEDKTKEDHKEVAHDKGATETTDSSSHKDKTKEENTAKKDTVDAKPEEQKDDKDSSKQDPQRAQNIIKTEHKEEANKVEDHADPVETPEANAFEDPFTIDDSD